MAQCRAAERSRLQVQKIKQENSAVPEVNHVSKHKPNKNRAERTAQKQEDAQSPLSTSNNPSQTTPEEKPRRKI